MLLPVGTPCVCKIWMFKSQREQRKNDKQSFSPRIYWVEGSSERKKNVERKIHVRIYHVNCSRSYPIQQTWQSWNTKRKCNHCIFQRTSANLITVERHRLLPRYVYLPSLRRPVGVRSDFTAPQKATKASIFHWRGAAKNVQQRWCDATFTEQARHSQFALDGRRPRGGQKTGEPYFHFIHQAKIAAMSWKLSLYPRVTNANEAKKGDLCKLHCSS